MARTRYDEINQLPKSAMGYPVKQWGNVWKELRGGRWIPVHLETLKRCHNER